MLLKLILCVGLLLCCITGVMSISSLDVYTDAVDSPFTDTRSSSLTRNPKDATQKHSGSYSYSFIPNLYEAIIFTSSSSISTSAYSSLTFWIYRPTGGSTSISFALVSLSSGFPTKIAFNLPVTIFTNNGWPENQWVQGIVDFSIYNTTNFDGFWFQDTSGLSTNLNKIFFDDIILEIGDPTVATFYNTIQSGQATYYGAYTNGGSCGLDPTPFAGINGIYSTVAIADPQYLGSKACGMCVIFTTTGTGSTSLVFVNNECPSCNTGGLDLGLNGDGIFNITWQATPCPVGTTLIQYQLKDSTPNKLVLQASNTKYPVYLLDVLVGGSWVNMPRQDNNYFAQTFSAAVSFPISIRLTSVFGQVLTDAIAYLVNNVVFSGSVQF